MLMKKALNLALMALVVVNLILLYMVESGASFDHPIPKESKYNYLTLYLWSLAINVMENISIQPRRSLLERNPQENQPRLGPGLDPHA